MILAFYIRPCTRCRSLVFFFLLVSPWLKNGKILCHYKWHIKEYASKLQMHFTRVLYFGNKCSLKENLRHYRGSHPWTQSFGSFTVRPPSLSLNLSSLICTPITYYLISQLVPIISLHFILAIQFLPLLGIFLFSLTFPCWGPSHVRQASTHTYS